ncbi:DUF3408 domain-containing protein [Dysgonomonas mossii]|uniref:DUF3408 domain-containing protein n=1 Tax=Dysgonomonas mossii TaxID=163665 RepID=A0A4Y9ISE8_9BACT|nr:DUF3408 domain-containing protein [Dysgonomonas mossii]MBF0760187.1 DUF3408 domain-containing protein [Dysgonomonas mossii]TFU91136.1 DUF3408 domain-containing protein [Dysgonomonas mossii]
MANKEKEYEIDEDFLLASIGDHKEGKPPLKKEEAIADDKPIKPKDSSANSKRNKRNSNTEDYEELFLCRNEIRQRQGVYISQSVHQTIMQIVKQIAGNDVSVGGYIDNVLKHHLGKYKDEINSLYKQDRTNLID